jgi:putative phosphoesterase
MKVVIISDVHGNLDALSALPEGYDELWVLGDLVNYGPQPAEVVEFVRAKASLVIRGNHDHAVGFSLDSRCSPRFREMATATQKFSESVLSPDQKEYLRKLPMCAHLKRNEKTFYLCHAVPSDPLYTYCQANSDQWMEECNQASADILLIGHTHLPFIRKVGDCTIVNPGSLGQPKTGRPEACYAIWDNGKVELKSFAYPVEETVSRLKSLALPKAVQNDLVHVLRMGTVPVSQEKTELCRAYEK